MTNPLLRVRNPTGSGSYSARKFAPEQRVEARNRRRPAWRQKLIEAERGLTHSFRADSTLYLYVFFDCLLLATCGVLGLRATHWAIVVSGLAAMLAAELFSQGMQAVASELSLRVQKRAASVSAAAKLLVCLGSSLMIGIVLWLRFRELFGV